MPARIRPADARDVEQLFTLAGILATSFTPERAPFYRAFAHLFKQEDALILVAEEGGKLQGYLLGFDHFAFFANGRLSYVEELFVQESHRGYGLGKPS